MSQAVHYVSVALGGALGASFRYAINLGLASSIDKLPAATLLVNVLGSFMAGFLTTWFLHRSFGNISLQLFLTVGFLGAFTTFSAFSVETMRLFEAGHLGSALANVFLNLLACLLAVFIGAAAARLV